MAESLITLSEKLTNILKGWWHIQPVKKDLIGVFLLMIYVTVTYDDTFSDWDPFWMYIDADLTFFFSPILFLVVVASYHLFLKLTTGEDVPTSTKKDVTGYLISVLKVSWCLLFLSFIVFFLDLGGELLPDALLFYFFYLQVIQIIHLAWILGTLAELHIAPYWKTQEVDH